MSPTELAEAKAQAKRAVIDLLVKLPRQAQADVLADLRLAVSNNEIVATDDSTAGPTWAARSAVSALRAPTAKAEPEAAPKGSKRRSRHRARKGAKTEAVLEALRRQPRAPIADLAAIVYPGESDAGPRVRAILFNLGKQGRVKRAASALGRSPPDRNPEPTKRIDPVRAGSIGLRPRSLTVVQSKRNTVRLPRAHGRSKLSLVRTKE